MPTLSVSPPRELTFPTSLRPMPLPGTQRLNKDTLIGKIQHSPNVIGNHD